MAWKHNCTTCGHFRRNGVCYELVKVADGHEIHNTIHPHTGGVIIDRPTIYFCALHTRARELSRS